MLLILILWSLAASSFSPRLQGIDDTPTPTIQATDTELQSPAPSASPSAAPTATLTVAPATRIRPTATIESQASDTPLPPAQLSGDYAPDEVLDPIPAQSRSKMLLAGVSRQPAASVESEIDELSVLVVKVPNGSVAESIAKLSACPETRLAEPNYLVHIADIIPSDPDWSAQYGLVNIRAPSGWSLSTGSPAVTIAIIDTGVDLGHPDLSAKIVGGHDFVNNDNSAQDDNGHGTHVAGIAAAVTNNGRGVAGVSWGARIMPVKVLDAAGNGTFADVAAGITWAADHGAQVINLSLGGTSASSVLQDAVDYASAKGVVIVAAAGNYGANFVLYPARFPNVIAVAATDSTNARADFSDYGPEVDVAAPGVDILSTFPGGYGYLSGTSMSTPFVAGLAAILRGIPGSGSPDAIAFDMESTALDLGPSGPDSFYGYGLIQMDAAIRLVLPPTPTPLPSSTFAPRARSGRRQLPDISARPKFSYADVHSHSLAHRHADLDPRCDRDSLSRDPRSDSRSGCHGSSGSQRAPLAEACFEAGQSVAPGLRRQHSDPAGRVAGMGLAPQGRASKGRLALFQSAVSLGSVLGY